MDKTKDLLAFGDLKSQSLNESEYTNLLFKLTGCIYTFATASQMRWGAEGKVSSIGDDSAKGYTQIMPDSLDDGFFDWYCHNRPDHQFFVSVKDASLQFIYYWLKWNNSGKPKAF